MLLLQAQRSQATKKSWSNYNYKSIRTEKKRTAISCVFKLFFVLVILVKHKDEAPPSNPTKTYKNANIQKELCLIALGQIPWIITGKIKWEVMEHTKNFWKTFLELQTKKYFISITCINHPNILTNPAMNNIHFICFYIFVFIQLYFQSSHSDFPLSRKNFK